MVLKAFQSVLTDLRYEAGVLTPDGCRLLACAMTPGF